MVRCEECELMPFFTEQKQFARSTRNHSTFRCRIQNLSREHGITNLRKFKTYPQSFLIVKE